LALTISVYECDAARTPPERAGFSGNRNERLRVNYRRTEGFMKRVVAALAIVLLVWSSGVAAKITPAGSRKTAPEFTLEDSNGAPLSLSKYKGKVVALDFWATWCTGCKVEIPWFMEFEKKYKDAGLATIGAAMDAEGWEKVRPYVAEHPFNYPLIAGDAAFAKKFNITGLPVTILIDRYGRIADVHGGMVNKGAWEKEVRTLLRE
jgi:peroxiredoxin